jgi:pimeloyl-ACP methyl ester carboxylesterase
MNKPYTAILAAFALAGCFSAPVPMTTLKDAYTAGTPKCAMVLLPGAGDSGQNYIEEKFVEQIRAKNLAVDLYPANATLGYYLKGTALPRLEEDVFKDIYAKGYQQVWVLGISMGGFGSLHYTSNHPKEVTGVLSLAPWLGDEKLLKEIKAAGGPAKWKPDPYERPTEDNYQRQLWSFIARTAQGEPGPKLYLGFGTEDDLAEANELYASALPPERVFRTPGKHVWDPWRKVLGEFLEKSDFAKDCAP